MADPDAEATAGSVGEFGLIGLITARLPRLPGVIVGPGDDTALVAVPDGRVAVTTDLLVEGRHFRRDWSSAADVGHKATAANLADIAAMGAVPTALVVGLGAPAGLPARWAIDCARGIADEAAGVGAAVVGGDVVASDAVVISITALGTLQGRAPVLRSGARPGDVLAIAGRVGWSAAGLALLEAGAAGPEELIAAHRRPAPAYQAGPQAALAGATSMIDVSDGLVADARHLAQASGVTIAIRTAGLMVTEAMRRAADLLGADVWSWALLGGEDHGLLATFPANANLPQPFRVIGEVVGQAINVAGGQSADRLADRVPGTVEVDGTAWSGTGGFDHFR